MSFASKPLFFGYRNASRTKAGLSWASWLILSLTYAVSKHSQSRNVSGLLTLETSILYTILDSDSAVLEACYCSARSVAGVKL
ncbi:hypothetical protein F5Y03DRAFT_378551 [Xylaria venustula]|nr:hypothetical protein F5Y03DRAFT_378551 [Xylaria venustula]